MAYFEFTPDQKAAIESKANMVITACPGSGKTSVIVEKIRREVTTLKPFQGIIGITFTLKASKELKHRCKRDGLDAKASFFGTIDHFCLAEFILPFISKLYGPTTNSLECKTYTYLSNEFKVCLPDLCIVGNELKTEHYQIYESVFRSLHQSGIILLESLGIIAVHILKNSEACRKYIKSRYTSLYIDEYQDSSQPQHQLFLALLELGLTAVAVGDVRQSIYAWRGSDPKYIRDLIEKPDVFEHYIVNINHRCHPSITNYSNRLFDNISPLLPTHEIRVYHWMINGTQRNIVDHLNTSIKKLLNDGIVSSLSEIAILVRYNNSIEFIKDGLNVPFRIFNDDPLSLINSRASKVMSNLLAYYFDHKTLINDIIELVSQYRSLTHSQRLSARSVIKKIGGCDNRTIKQAIINATNELLNEEATEPEVSTLECILNDQSLLKQYKPTDENEVQVMTLHKSKGLEFNVVFHLDLYDWIFPKREFIQGYYEEVFSSWEQDLNLHYVGITRAKEYCILISSTQRINSYNEIKNGTKSQFMNLDGLIGLYI
jgi:DNA helicase-2/ATP-dependent DNA helicase PcrA